MPTKNKLVKILEGTANEKTFRLENPTNPTESDILKIKSAYGIPVEFSAQEATNALNELAQAEVAGVLSDIPYEPGSKQFNNEIMAKIADVQERKTLIEDPANYLFKNFQQKILGGKLDRFIPDELVSKPTFEAAGSMGAMAAAGVLTKSLSGAAASKVVGADVLGAQGAGQIYEFTNQVLRYLNDLPQEDKETQRAKFLEDAYMNLAFTGGAASLGPIFKAFKPTIGKIVFGVGKTKDQKRMMELAETYGVPLGIIQATDYKGWKAYSQIIGVFPYIGTPFKRTGEAANEAVRQYVKRMSNSFAPLQTMSALGMDFTKMLGDTYSDTRVIQEILYEDFGEYAAKLGDKKVINIGRTKQLAKEFSDIFVASVPLTSGGKRLKYPGDGSTKAFGEFYETMSNVDPDITIDQAKTMLTMFSDFMANFKTEFKGTIPKEQAANLSKMRQMFEKELNTLTNLDGDVDKVIFDTAVKKLTTANDYFAMTSPQFKGGVADNFKQVNANIFGPGPTLERGVMYPGEVMEIVVGRAKKDPVIMEHLLDLSRPTRAQMEAYKKAGFKEGVPVENITVMVRDIDPDSATFGKLLPEKQTVVSVAPEAGRQKIMRYLLDDAFKKSLIGVPPSRTPDEYLNLSNIDTFDIQQKGFQKIANQSGNPKAAQFKEVRMNPDILSRELGLDTVEGRQVLEEVLQGTGTKITDIDDFIRVADAAGSFTIRDPAKFVERRVTLSGFKGAMFFGGATAGVGIIKPSTLIIPLILRYGSHILTNPKVLKALTARLSDEGFDVAKRKVLMDWAERTLQSDEEVEQEKFEQDINQAIFNLQMNPQTEGEARRGRQKQINMMQKGINREQLNIGENIANRLGTNLTAQGPRFTETPSVASTQYQDLSNAARNSLAFGTIDDAIAAERGIAGL
jgi:hypothetical protein